MSAGYQAVQWNRQKYIYDAILIAGVALFIGDGIVAAGYFITWQIALFLTLDQSYLAYGGALAIASLVGAVS